MTENNTTQVEPTTPPVVQPNPATVQPTPVHNPMDPPPEANPLEGTSFSDTKALVDGYKSLQAELTRLKQGQTQPEPEAPAGETVEATETTDTAEESTSDTPTWDYGSTFEHYDPEKGWDESAVQHFESLGIPKDILDEVAQIKQQRDEYGRMYFRTQAEQMVGGSENLDQVVAFVSEKMPEAVDDLNNPSKFQYVLEAAVSRMRREGVLGGAPASTEASGAPEANPTQRGVSGEVLVPGSPEALKALSDARMYSDREYATRVRAALARGTQK
jgi:hypothetical protein